MEHTGKKAEAQCKTENISPNTSLTGQEEVITWPEKEAAEENVVQGKEV